MLGEIAYSTDTGKLAIVTGSNTTGSNTTGSNTTGSNTTGSNTTGSNYNSSVIVTEEMMEKRFKIIEKRLSILVPDPLKLKKYEALKKAYEHYKMLEILLEENE